MAAPRSPSGETPWRLAAVVAATLAFRLIAGSLSQLTEDEAYYRLWSFSPAFGYFDHPPVIAWWIWLGRQACGDTALGVRLLPALATAASGVLVFDMARLAGAGQAVAERAAIWFNATLLVLAGGFLATPDAPASLFWCLTLWCMLRAARSDALLWWLGAGAAAGLACLSKYSALFLGPGVLLWLASTASGRRSLHGPGPWLALSLAVAIFTPNLVWNASHGWLTFAKQFGRLTAHRLAPTYAVELVFSQAVLLNPLIAVFVVSAITDRRVPASLDWKPFAFVSGPFAAYLLLHSLHDRVQAHWPAPLYPAAAILAAFGAETRTLRPLARAAAPAGFAIAAGLLALLAAPGALLGRYDLALPVRGWAPFSERLNRLARAGDAAWVATSSYGLTAELADEPGLTLPVFQLAERDRWRELSQPVRPDLGHPGLAIDLTRRLTADNLRGCFRRVTPLGVMVRGDPGEPGKSYAVFAVADPTRNVLEQGCWKN